MPHTIFHPIMLNIISVNEFQKLSPLYSSSFGQHAKFWNNVMPYLEFSKISNKIAALSTTTKDVSGEVSHTIVPIITPTRMCTSDQTSMRLFFEFPILHLTIEAGHVHIYILRAP